MANLRQPNSPLLSLPAELRNAIYECVVDTSTGLVFFIEHRGFVITSSNRTVASEANPLQRVCRLTRAETRKLELQKNDIGSKVRSLQA
jgi:hypothetical protein